MLRQELELGYFKWIHKPGEDLGVFDNASDYEECKRRVHCNCTHGSIAPELVYKEETKSYELDKSQMLQKLKDFNSMEKGRRRTIMTGADHNNVYFPNFIRYKTTLPECLMQKADGSYLELHDELICDGEGIPMPAIDDPTLITRYSEALAEQAKLLKDSQYVAAYMLGFEELYPEYFNLGHGDFRPASWKHFMEWCIANDIPAPESKEEAASDEISPEWMKWYRFREQAMADRCVNYYRAILNEDANHLIYYPTHGSTLSDTRRAQLGQQPSSLACSCDGMEMGHIMIENDRERRNVIMTSHYTSFGAPVIVPRLGNKQVDLSAIGGGRSFTRETLRRFIYECIGLGIDKIFPIHWSSRLHDGEWFIKDTEAEEACLEVFDEIIGASVYLYGMGRMQPQIGILACDATWIEEWNPRWTALMQDAYRNHSAMTIVSDAIISKHLAGKMPILILPDNYRIGENTIQKLIEYLNAGGKVILWGRFGEETEELTPLKEEIRSKILNHPNVYYDKTPQERETRVLRELFLAGPDCGIAGPRFEFTAISYSALEQAIQQHAPECILKPAILCSKEDLGEVNVYTLTDRSSLIYVFINNGSKPVSFHFGPDPRLIQDYAMLDIITEQELGEDIALGANATKMIWVYQKKSDRDTEKKVLLAEKAFEGWQRLGADVSALRHCYAHIQTGAYQDKRYSLANTIMESLAIKAECIRTEEGLRMCAKVFNAEQEAVSGITVTFRFTPGTFQWFECTERAGEYYCDIPAWKLPTYYDVRLQKYLPVKGIVRMVIHAEGQDRQGGCVMNLEL
jgi:hypothetical protein